MWSPYLCKPILSVLLVSRDNMEQLIATLKVDWDGERQEQTITISILLTIIINSSQCTQSRGVTFLSLSWLRAFLDSYRWQLKCFKWIKKSSLMRLKWKVCALFRKHPTWTSSSKASKSLIPKLPGVWYKYYIYLTIFQIPLETIVLCSSHSSFVKQFSMQVTSNVLMSLNMCRSHKWAPSMCLGCSVARRPSTCFTLKL